jgi:hypothetical protein
LPDLGSRPVDAAQVVDKNVGVEENLRAYHSPRILS